MVTDPLHTHNVMADHADVAQQLFDLIGTWLDGLEVSRARKQQLLNNAPFTLWNRLGYNSWLAGNRLSHWMNYRGYASGG